MGTTDSMKSVLTPPALDALCEKYHIPDVVHPELPGRHDKIRSSPAGKIGVYSRFFNFANYRIPLSQFLIDILAYFQINLSLLSVITAAKVSHFEILCHVHGFVPTVGNFHRFYINSTNKGWMSFSKHAENAPICYTTPLDSLNNWNDHFFWVDASAFPLAVPWHSDKTLKKDPHPTPAKFDADVCNYLADNPAPFRKFLKPFLCFVGISRYYDLDEDCYPTFWANVDEDLFAFINHAEVSLLQLTRGRVVPFAGVNDQENVNVQGVGDADVNEGDGDAVKVNQTEQGVHVVDVGGMDVVADDEVQAIVTDKPKRIRKKRKAADCAGGSVAVLQSLLESSTLPVEVGVTAAATVPFVPSSMIHDSIFGTGLRTQHPAKRFVISLDSSHDLNADVTDDEVTSVIRDSASPSVAEADVVSPSQPVGIELSEGIFYVSQHIDSGALRQIYIPTWNVVNDSALDDSEICQCMIDHLAPLRMRLEHELRGRQKFKEKAEAAEVFRLRGQIATVEAAKAARVNELNDLKERNVALEGQVTALESATASKDAELASSSSQVAKMTQDLSNLQLSCDELSVKASSLEFKKDKLIDQVFVLENTCSGLRDEVMGYKLFKEQIEAVQDVQVKVLIDRVADLDAELMRMALHLDEEFYPRYLTTIDALGGVIGRAIDKGIQDGLAAGIDHGKAGRVLAKVVANDPAAEANYGAVVNALHDVDFPFLAQLASHKDSSMADLMDLLRLEGPAAEALEVEQLQPSLDQLMLPIHQLEDQVVIGETSLSFSLDLAYARVQKLKENVVSRQLSISNALVPIVEPLSVENLIGEASTLGVPTAIATTTALSTTFVETSSVPLIPHVEAPHSSIVFKKKELDTTPKHTAAP
ncbi:hypothetical protein Tco_0888398 [Tanacetum coccineum]